MTAPYLTALSRWEDDVIASENAADEVAEAAAEAAGECREWLAMYALAKALPDGDVIAEAIAEHIWDACNDAAGECETMEVREELLASHVPSVERALEVLAREVG